MLGSNELQKTARWSMESEHAIGAAAQEQDGAARPGKYPERIGRYRIKRSLGQGSFGQVFLAEDESLQRHVAIKVPHPHLIRRPRDVDAFLIEARILAGLDHPNVVPVYDVGSNDEFPCYLVSAYIPGTTLAQRLREDQFSRIEAAELTRKLADALHAVHKRGVVHRDIKPGNILLDAQQEPHVVDFGLALHEANFGEGPAYMGTPAYMSPEQACGEGHRVDGRSDIYSLGAVLYELLTGRWPFAGSTREELLERIIACDVKPPRQIDETIPKELERICLRALSKRVTDRYTTAADLADDLRQFASERPSARLPPTSAQSPAVLADEPTRASAGSDSQLRGSEANGIRVIPKGLRSFDDHDADFFLKLLPGPRDRNGLPESIRFWKTRIEAADPDRTFSIGMLYGPSGCGKSSFMKAGLLPRLAETVLPVYVEASFDGTEERLLSRLRKNCRFLSDRFDLKESLTVLRRDGHPEGKKVLLVLDQFEQWLHATNPDAGLVRALRQCDGKNVQCILLVRDDFWMAASRLMRDLEVRLVEGHNSAAFDRFPVQHAERVLAAFGQALGALPETSDSLSEQQRQFITSAVEALSEKDQVNCIRLALFAEMMKVKPWTQRSLQQVGGADGIGLRFLDETFSSRSAPPEHRYHERAARAVLNVLLPRTGMDLKGSGRTREELLSASGYVQRPDKFDRLLSILDSELRLITPVDPPGADPDESTECTAAYYQLTHDFIVPPLRQWLTRKQQETRRGRAELRFAEHASLWNARPENRYLPSAWEYINFRVYTRRSDWTRSQACMMRQATRHHVGRALLGLALALAIGWTAYGIHARARVEGLIRSLETADTERLPAILDELEAYAARSASALGESSASVDASAKMTLHRDLARLRLGTFDQNVVGRIGERLRTASPEETKLIAQEISPHAPVLLKNLWSVLASSADVGEVLAAATVLARHSPNDQRWKKHADALANTLISSNPVHAPGWTSNLAPIRRFLAPPLREFFVESASVSAGSTSDVISTLSAQRRIAAAALAEYLRTDPEQTAELLVGYASEAHEFHALFEPLSVDPAGSAHLLKKWLDLPSPSSEGQAKRLSSTASRANALLALLLLDSQQQPRIAQYLQGSSDPALRSRLIHQCASLGFPPGRLGQLLLSETSAETRAALLLALGEYSPEIVSQPLLRSVEQQVAASARSTHAGQHAAALWLAGRWKLELPRLVDPPPAPRSQGWFQGPDGHHLVIVRDRLDHNFAIASREVTIEQIEQFNPQYRDSYVVGLREFLAHDPPSGCPAIYISAYDAMQYCNWLSMRDGISPDQLCYEEVGDGTLRPRPNHLQFNGYRLPDYEEWVAACQGGVEATFSFGTDLDLLPKYAWYYSNSREEGRNRAQPVGLLKPNVLGLWDMYGNVWEWTTDFRRASWSILCGGSCDNDPIDLIPVGRVNAKRPELREHRIGFRIARTVKDGSGTRDPDR